MHYWHIATMSILCYTTTSDVPICGRLEVVNMTAKCSGADLDNAIQAYVAGESAEAIAQRTPFLSAKRLLDALETRGIRRSRSERYALAGQKAAETQRAQYGLPDIEIVNRYIAGESENALAHVYGTSRSVIRARLCAAGIPIRGQTEANRLITAQTPTEILHDRIAIAQEATRGRRQTKEHRHKIAKTRQAKEIGGSLTESVMADWLRARGLDIVPQQAIGPYNIDLGAYPVAVEILGGYWHLGKPIHPKRTRYLLNQGWHVVFVWSHPKRSPILPSAADYIVAFAQEIRGQPPSICQYRVIRGDGYELARGQADSENVSPIAPGCESFNGSPSNK